jgi:hypothetical protein
MKTKINLLIFFLALTTTLLQSQTTPKFQWVKGGGSQGVASNSSLKESCKWMGTDAHGNIYGMSSLFNMNIQIDTSFRPYGFGYDDFAVFSYRCDGSMRWVRYFGSFPNDIPVGMFIDNMGNSYIAGHVSICDLGDAYLGDSIIPQTFTKSKSAFVAKLDSNGHTLWVNYPGPDMPVVPAIATLLHSQPDNQGNLCVLAMFSGAATWDSFIIPSKGNYIVKFDKNNGNLIEVTKIDYDKPHSKIYHFQMDDQNSIYIGEVTQKGDTIFTGNNVITTDNDSILIHFLAKYSSSGNLVWYKTLTNNSWDPNYTENIILGNMVFIDNYLYIGGYAQKNASVFGYTINNPFLEFPVNKTIYIAKFNRNTGDFVSLKHFYNKKYVDHQVYTSKNGNILSAGATLGVIMTNLYDTIKPYGGTYDKAYPFIVELDSSMNQFNWSIATRVTGDYSRIEAITVDMAGNIYAGGKTTDSIYDSFGTGYQSHGGSSDFFITKIATHNNCSCILSQPYPQLLGINNKTITVKGIATGIADSLYWNWGDGTTTAYTAQNTNITHTYATGGNYTVCLHTTNYCGSKDSCFTVNGVGITEQELKYLNAYPNPVTNSLIIENPYQCSMQLNIYSITGKLLYSNKYENYTTSIDMSNYEKGIYFVEMILADGRKALRKIVRS